MQRVTTLLNDILVDINNYVTVHNSSDIEISVSSLVDNGCKNIIVSPSTYKIFIGSNLYKDTPDEIDTKDIYGYLNSLPVYVSSEVEPDKIFPCEILFSNLINHNFTTIALKLSTAWKKGDSVAKYIDEIDELLKF